MSNLHAGTYLPSVSSFLLGPCAFEIFDLFPRTYVAGHSLTLSYSLTLQDLRNFSFSKLFLVCPSVSSDYW